MALFPHLPACSFPFSALFFFPIHQLTAVIPRSKAKATGMPFLVFPPFSALTREISHFLTPYLPQRLWRRRLLRSGRPSERLRPAVRQLEGHPVWRLLPEQGRRQLRLEPGLRRRILWSRRQEGRRRLRRLRRRVRVSVLSSAARVPLLRMGSSLTLSPLFSLSLQWLRRLVVWQFCGRT